MLQRKREQGANLRDRSWELGQDRYKRILEVSITVVPTKERVPARELGHQESCRGECGEGKGEWGNGGEVHRAKERARLAHCLMQPHPAALCMVLSWVLSCRPL